MQRTRNGQVFVLLAPGCEELDVTTVTRILRREGFPVTVVGLTAGPIRGAYGVSLMPDETLNEAEAEQPQAVVLPSGMQGTRQLDADPRVHTLLRLVVGNGGFVLALDTAYTVLHSAGVLDIGEAQSNIGLGAAMVPSSVSRWRGGRALSERVVVEGQIVFGRDSGTAHEAALRLAAVLGGGGFGTQYS